MRKGVINLVKLEIMFPESLWPSFSIYSYLFVTLYLKDIFLYPCTSGIPILCIFDNTNLAFWYP